MHWKASIMWLTSTLPQPLSRVLLSFTQPSVLTAEWKTVKLLFIGTDYDIM